MNKAISFVSALFLPLVAFADNFKPELLEELKKTEGEPNLFMNEFMSMLTTLGIVVAVLFVLSWMLKGMLHTRVQQANTTSLIKILERRSLSPKTSIYLLEINGKQLVVGESINGLRALGEVPTIENEAVEGNP